MFRHRSLDLPAEFTVADDSAFPHRLKVTGRPLGHCVTSPAECLVVETDELIAHQLRHARLAAILTNDQAFHGFASEPGSANELLKPADRAWHTTKQLRWAGNIDAAKFWVAVVSRQPFTRREDHVDPDEKRRQGVVTNPEALPSLRTLENERVNPALTPILLPV
jgi:hypothetical protein